MAFPPAPADQDLHKEGGNTYQWVAAGGAWIKVTGVRVFYHDGTTYVHDPDSIIYIQKTGDPAPASSNTNDILLPE